MATSVTIPTQSDTGSYTGDPTLGCSDTSILVTQSGEATNVSSRTSQNAMLTALKAAAANSSTYALFQTAMAAVTPVA